jgi:CheY-like chemotaxis protein
LQIGETDQSAICNLQSAIGHAVVTVHDTGIGIDREVLPRVFDTFTQADRSLNRSRGGLGLGLALVKGLVEMHGGAVRAESEGHGRGSAFTFRLPLSTGEPAPVLPAEAAPVEVVGQRVLIVEDNRDAADALHDLLEMQGYEVEVAYTGRDGLDLAGRFRPEVVLCDLGLPELDGYEVGRALRRDAQTRAARLIAISGYGQEEDRRRSRAAGFDMHLTKPVDIALIRQILAAPLPRERDWDPGTPASSSGDEVRSGEPTE